ncbi:MAG TPA: alpha-2-macroglobulin family protein [Patescibacteria group bacterium]|nr:alpha-2-macroglobulin family protein [Patescibacteria group bacterium]
MLTIRKFLFSSVLLGLSVAAFFYFHPSQAVTPNEVQQGPRIFISGGEYQASSEIIPMSAAAAPEVQLMYNGDYGYSEPKSPLVKLSLYEVTKEDLFKYLIYDGKDNSKRKFPKPDYSRSVKVFENTVDLKKNEGKITLPLKESAVYIVETVTDGAIDRAFIVRSRNAAVMTETKDDYMFWVQDLKTGTTVKDYTVTAYTFEDAAKETGKATVSNNNLGFMPISTNAELVLVETESDMNLIPVNIRTAYYNFTGSFGSTFNSRKFYFITDRPIYKPGDTISYKAIIRDDDDGAYTLPSGVVHVKLFKDWSEREALVQQTSTIAKDGTVAGKLVIPKDSGTGYFQISIQDQASNENNNWNYGNYTSVQIEEYRKPEYTLDSSFDRMSYAASEKITAKISGQYFFGPPLADQEVSYHIYTNDVYNNWYYGDSEDELNYYFYGGNEVGSGTARLNENGELLLDMPQVDFAESAEGTTAKVISVEATYKDRTQNQVVTMSRALVRKNNIKITRTIAGSTYGWYYAVAGKPINHVFTVSDLAGKTLPDVPVTMQVHRESHGYVNGDWKGTSEDYKAQKFISDNSGKIAYNFTPQVSGSYTFTLTGKDTSGKDFSVVYNQWVSGGEYDFWWSQQDTQAGVTLAFSQQTYQPNATMRLQFTSNLPDHDALLVIERDYVKDYKVVRVTGGRAVAEFPVEGSYMPNIFARGYEFGPYDLRSTTAEAEVSALGQKLNVSVQTDKQSYGPGDNVRATVVTTDQNGKPVSADTVLYSIDKAIYELATENRQHIFDSFYSKRGQNTAYRHSLMQSYSSGAERGGCFVAGTKVTLTEGTVKNIEDILVGDSVLSYDESARKYVSQKVTATHRLSDMGYLLINGSLKVTPNHLLYESGAWKPAGDLQIGDVLLTEKGPAPVESLEWVLGEVTVYNLTVANTHNFFAGHILAHNDKGDTAVRSNFKDTAYWNPHVVTGADGKATVTFKLPDNLTTWVIRAVSANAATQVGETKNEIVVTKPFIMRPIVPNVLRVGDKVVLAAYISNYSGKELDINADVTYEGKKVLPIQGEHVALQNKKSKLLEFEVTPTQASEAAEFQFNATDTKDKKLSDSYKQVLPVRYTGVKELVSEIKEGSGDFTVRFPKDAVNDLSKAKLVLTASMVGQVPEAMRYLIDYPYGCVEQTMSRFAPVLLAQGYPEILKEASEGKDLNDMVRVGISKLKELQNPNGSWGYWHDGYGNVFNTVYVVEYLKLAEARGFSEATPLLRSARSYLENSATEIHNYNPSYYPTFGYDGVRTEKEVAEYEKKTNIILRAYGLALLGSGLDKFPITDVTGVTPDTLAMAAMTNRLNGFTAQADVLNAELLKQGISEGSSMHWKTGLGVYYGSEEASTAFAVKSLLQQKDRYKNQIVQALNFLAQKKKRNYWVSTYTTVQVVSALLKSSDGSTKVNTGYTVTLGSQTLATGNITSPTAEVVVPLKIDPALDGSKLSVASNGGTLYSMLVESLWRTDVDKVPVSSKIKFERTYENAEHEGWAVRVGDIVNVKIKVSGDLSSDYAVIEDRLPAGLIPVNKNLLNEKTGGYSQHYYYGDWGAETTLEGARISQMYDWGYGGGSQREYSYQARAVVSGDFTAPPVMYETMYTGKSAHSGSQVFHIEPPYAERAFSFTRVTEEGIGWKSIVGSIILIILIFYLVLLHNPEWQVKLLSYIQKGKPAEPM